MKDIQSLPVLDVRIGSKIELNERDYVITNLIELDVILCKEVASGQQVILKLGDLNNPRNVDPIRGNTNVSLDLQAVSSEQWRDAQLRKTAADAILAKDGKHGTGFYKQLAAKHAVSVATLYRWADLYRSSGYRLSSLLTTKRDGGRGVGRIDERVEAVISNYIKHKWLTTQQRSIKTAAEDIRAQCHSAGLPLPSPKTIRLRMAWLEQREIVAKREGEARARDVFDASRGSIQDANWPLQMVQIDHTVLPVIIVDDEYRKPIRRAYITLIIDVFSRVCIGMHLSLDPPSNNSVGQCLAHAILLKDKWLARLNLPDNVKWPFWGTPEIVHADNAKEFRSEMMKVVADEYSIDIHWRPVKKPNYGAHIERLMGSVSTWLKEAPGATFSGPDEKGVYDADGNPSTAVLGWISASGETRAISVSSSSGTRA